jgi:hypothetical protein
MGASSVCAGVELVLPEVEDRGIVLVGHRRRGVLNIVRVSIVVPVIRIKPGEFPIAQV